MGTVHAKEVEVIGPQRPEMRNKEMPREKEILLSAVSAKVQHIHVEGLGRTKNDIVVKHVKEIFVADNFEEMVKKAGDAKLKMESLGLFKKVSLFIDTAKGKGSRPDGYDLTFKVQEHRRVAGGVSTLVGTNDGSLIFNMRLPNTFGRAERLGGEYSYGTKHATGLGLNFVKPLQGNPNLYFLSSAYQQSGDYPWSGFSEISKGVNASISFPTAIGQHQIQWEGVWREIGCLSNNVAFAVREEAGHNLKSSLKHIYTRDTRDSKVLPGSGTLVRSTQELAGLGGDVNYMKQDLELQYNKTLFLDTVFQASLAGGLIRSIQPETNLKLPDKFLIGGPLTLRGFNIKGCGPHTENCALGADTYWLAAAHIYTPLPFRRGRGGFGDYFRTHLFVNAGNLKNINLQDPVKQNLVSLGESFRWSYGAGLVLRMGGIARLELNYCIPVKSLRTDSVAPGFQFGIGVTFL